MSEQTSKNALKLGFFLVLIVGVLLIPNHLITYEKTSYPLVIVESYLESALATNNIEKKAEIAEETVRKLELYTGNSEWWYPRETTNIDITKETLASVARDIKKQIPVQDKEQWFILPHNELNSYVNNEIQTSLKRVDAYGDAYYWNPAHSLMLFHWLFFLASVAVFLTSCGISCVKYNW